MRFQKYFVLVMFILSCSLSCQCRIRVVEEPFEGESFKPDSSIVIEKKTNQPIDDQSSNCDAQVSEGCGKCREGQRRSCYPEIHKTGCSKTGSIFVCRSPCKAGIQICHSGKWEKCKEAIVPSLEVCDKKDNDCDGKIDNIKELGVSCDSGKKGLCGSGKWECTPFGIKICKVGKISQKEICDGLDNNCNGKIDEGFYLKKQCSVGKGTCKKAGFFVCKQDQTGSICSAAPGKEKIEICDGLDNDCDGRVDEGCVITIAGTGTDGYKDGPALSSAFSSPSQIVFDPQGSFLIGDRGNNRIRKLDKQGQVTTIAGDGSSGHKDGPALSASFYLFKGLAFDSQGNLYISDAGNNQIRKLDRLGQISTVAGTRGGGTKMELPLQLNLRVPKF